MVRNNENEFYFEDLPNGWRVGRFGALEGLDSVVHVVTTRKGPAISSDVEKVSFVAGELIEGKELHVNDIAYCRQVHGAEVLLAERGGLIGSCDGLVTNEPMLGLMGRSADCPLILAADTVSGAAGMAHASWRGTAGRIASRLVTSMVAHFDAHLDNIVACICPSAGPCCYEVGQDVLDAAVEGIGSDAKKFFHTRKGKMYFDLWAANCDALVRAGLREENIHTSGICTICRNDLFPSYRAEGESAARFAAVVAIR